MRGSIWTVGALGIAAAMSVLILGDIDVGGDETGETALALIASVDILIALAFFVTCFGLLLMYFTDSGF